MLLLFTFWLVQSSKYKSQFLYTSPQFRTETCVKQFQQQPHRFHHKNEYMYLQFHMNHYRFTQRWTQKRVNLFPDSLDCHHLHQGFKLFFSLLRSMVMLPTGATRCSGDTSQTDSGASQFPSTLCETSKFNSCYRDLPLLRDLFIDHMCIVPFCFSGLQRAGAGS